MVGHIISSGLCATKAAINYAGDYKLTVTKNGNVLLFPRAAKDRVKLLTHKDHSGLTFPATLGK